MTTDEDLPEAGMLRALLTRQYQLQRTTFGLDPVRMGHMDRRIFVTWNTLALEDELHEALGELDWKPWVDGEVFNRDAFMKELADAFHFFMNLLLVCGPSPDAMPGEDIIYALAGEFIDRYYRKSVENARRQEHGYDGRSEKCDCSRDIRDGVHLFTLKKTSHFKCPCGKTNHVAV